MAYSIMLDAGHGGAKDPGAVYEGRQEKDDNLKLVLQLERYCRTEDWM